MSLKTVNIGKFEQLKKYESKGLETPLGPVFTVFKEDQLFVYRNECPHRQITLEFQEDRFLDLEKNFIQCSTHGALFEIKTGLCISGPCQGQSLIPLSFDIISGDVIVAVE